MTCPGRVVLADGKGLPFGSWRAGREWYRTGACKVIFATICHNILKQHPELGLFRTYSLGWGCLADDKVNSWKRDLGFFVFLTFRLVL